MTLITTTKDPLVELPSTYTFEHAVSMRDNVVWDRLGNITVGEALEKWLDTIQNPLTEKNYRSGMRQLIEKRLLNPNMSLQAFSLVNSNAVVDAIKAGQKDWSESSKQARAGCYISFTHFLSRRFDGVIKRATPCKEGNSKTFFKVRDKVDTRALTQEQADAFIEALAEINQRDCLIAKILLQGGKRANEALTLKTDNINWNTCEITFLQSKTRGIGKTTIITYPGSVINELMSYVGENKGLVFRTTTGKKVGLNQLSSTFERAGKKANIPFKVTPHVLRATAVTLYKAHGCTDSELIGITGHATVSMMEAYNQSDLANNASKKVNLVS